MALLQFCDYIIKMLKTGVVILSEWKYSYFLFLCGLCGWLLLPQSTLRVQRIFLTKNKTESSPQGLLVR